MPDDSWAIDGTVMQYGGELYFIRSGRDGLSVWISPVTFDGNGKPDFGSHPVPEVTFPVPVK